MIDRSLNSNHEVRAMTAGDKKYLVGYAALFDVVSELLNEGGYTFYEVIKQGAFTNVLKSKPDVILNVGHDNNRLLARTTSGTLKLSQDMTGLKFVAELPKTPLADEVYELVKRGDHNQCSFVFWLDGSDGEVTLDRYQGETLRIIHRVAGLRDVSVVAFAAYPQTSVDARGKTLFDVVDGARGRSREAMNKIKTAWTLAMMEAGRKNFIKMTY